MSRYFLYGTRFSEFEEMMMLVPNFIPRTRGVIITDKLESKERQMQNNLSYKAMLKNSFSNLQNRYLNKRWRDLLR